MNFIYKIENKTNGKNYIGQTNNPSLRWSQHKSNAKYNITTQVITRALIKHGVENFSFNVIATSKSLDDVNMLEEEMILQHDSRNPLKGYNVDTGGGVAPRPQEVNDKISVSLKKFYETHDGSFVGKKHTDETKRNMSAISMGKDGTNTGKTFDHNWVLKIAKAQAGSEKKASRRFSEEQEIEICRLYVEEGLSTYKIGQVFKCVRTTIADILGRRKIPTRQSSYTGHSNNCNKFSIEEEIEICKDHESGKYTRLDLSKKYKCGKTTIRDVLLRNKIKL